MTKIIRRQTKFDKSTTASARAILDRLAREAAETKLERVPSVGRVRQPVKGAAAIAGQ
jgi:hypothetical protein